jgi:hypothetical protein
VREPLRHQHATADPRVDYDLSPVQADYRHTSATSLPDLAGRQTTPHPNAYTMALERSLGVLKVVGLTANSSRRASSRQHLSMYGYDDTLL